jgi:hypothetical protein
MARTTLDLIRDLQAQAPKFTGLQLVVAFESSCTFISADEQGALGALNRAVQDGGEPIGFIGWIIKRQSTEIFTKLLEEYRNDTSAEEFVTRIASEKGKAVERLNHGPIN